jgi:hypothetical protein
MKNKKYYLIYVILTILFFVSIHCQSLSAQEPEKKTKLSPEFTISLCQDYFFFIGNFGFGTGIYNAFFNEKRCNLIVGLEYNGNYTYATVGSEPSYTKNYIGIPAYFRVNMFKKVKFFIETGTFFDPIVFKRIKQTTELNGITLFFKPDFGVSGGLGLRIPVNRYEILIKSDIKFSMGGFIKSYSRPYSGDIYCSHWRFIVGFKM